MVSVKTVKSILWKTVMLNLLHIILKTLNFIFAPIIKVIIFTKTIPWLEKKIFLRFQIFNTKLEKIEKGPLSLTSIAPSKMTYMIQKLMTSRILSGI